jgi:hypothetical protein
LSVVAQDVDPQREVWEAVADGGGDGGHVGDDVGGHARGEEGDVAEVFDHEAVDAAVGQRVGVFENSFDEGLHVLSCEARRAGEGGEVEHADDDLFDAGPGGQDGEQGHPCSLTTREPWTTECHEGVIGLINGGGILRGGADFRGALGRRPAGRDRLAARALRAVA